MFIDYVLSTVAVPGTFIGSGSEELLSRTFDYEDGPIAIKDPTKGHRYQQWRGYIKNGEAWIEADNLPKFMVASNPFNTITDISIAFTQNADLHYVIVDNGVATLTYWDTETGEDAELVLPEGSRTPKLVLDDKRPTQSGRNDVILSYVKDDNKLYFRQQRDKFAIEYLLEDGPFISIERLGMNNVWRLQWLMTRGEL